jgi:hypothetical protein
VKKRLWRLVPWAKLRDAPSGEMSLEPARAHVRDLLASAADDAKRGDWDAARVKYLAIQELPPAAQSALLSPAVLRTIQVRLAQLGSAAVGLCHKERRPDGRTQWVFEHEHSAPVAGVQTDARSVCPLVLTPSEVLDAALELAEVTASDTLADLGCGDGRMLVRVAGRGARAVGFDVNPRCLSSSRAAATKAGCSERVEVIDHDLLALQGHPRFEAASVVYVYLVPQVVTRLHRLLRHAVASGKRVVIYCRSGTDRERPGNVVAGLRPAAEAMGGLLRLYHNAGKARRRG